MKKNGFTLIETIGIIVIIALVSIVTVPIIINSTDKNRISESLCEDAKVATESYIAMKKGTIPDFENPGDVFEIRFDELITSGLLVANGAKDYNNKYTYVEVIIKDDGSFNMECKIMTK